MAKKQKKFKAILRNELESKLKEISKQVQEILLNAYDSELVVIDRRSKTNPQSPKYRDMFGQRLMSFEYIISQNNNIEFVLPDMETFDFSGNPMQVVQHILEGTAGIYMEVSAEDYEKMFGKTYVTKEPFDTDVPKKEIIYLMRYDNRLRTAERNTFGKNGYLVKYPFSNTPPIPILEAANQFVGTNMDRWVKEVVKTAERKFKQTT